MKDYNIRNPRNFKELIDIIQLMTFSNSYIDTNDKSKNVLVRLFPDWLLPAFIDMFAKPFPQFSAWMNAWVTHFTTRWLMGPSKIYDININNQILKEQGLLIEKC